MVLSILRRWFTDAPAPAQELPRDRDPLAVAEDQFQQGVHFAEGQGVAQDYVQAAACYRQAAEQNHCLAQLNLAILYGSGDGVVRDETISVRWLTRAARLGNAVAQYRLGVQQFHACKTGQTEAMAEGRIEAMKWLWLAAAKDCAGAVNASQFVALRLTREEVNEGVRRATGFVAG
jgi:uncharacterized protein